ncbi:MAG: hypothetical protein M1832_002693 [Thelocarpon impressellum]|nr:MAG: hypothetical protein M1832_002693 [Thelocarpon impressellum]
MATPAPAGIALHLPARSGPPTHSTPSPAFLARGGWHVTHSSLPMWTSKRNVRIEYAALPAAANGSARMDDLVSYQALGSAKVKTIAGVDTAKTSGGEGGPWVWRGKGWLGVATSHWEVLGFGGEGQGEWILTFFEKTLFTPSGIDICVRSERGLPEEVVGGIKAALDGLGDDELRDLGRAMFEVKRDGARAGA